MVIDLSVINDEKNKLEKTIYDSERFEGTLRNETSVINPVVLIEAENLSGFNYMYISQFGRYYFITDIVSVRTNLWRVHGSCDVLMSFADGIKKCTGILSDTESTGEESYMSGQQWKTLVKTKTDIVSFPNGLNETGEYILITSGGVAGV